MIGDGKSEDIREIEVKLAALERLADDLGGAPDDELVEALERAVGLLGEVNAGIEAGLRSAGEEERALGEVLDPVDFGPFDEALEELERQERSPGDGGP